MQNSSELRTNVLHNVRYRTYVFKVVVFDMRRTHGFEAGPSVDQYKILKYVKNSQKLHKILL